MSVPTVRMTPSAPAFGCAAIPRFGGPGKPPGPPPDFTPGSLPGIILAPADSVGLDDIQLMVKKLYVAVRDDILDRESGELAALPLTEKAGLIRQFRDTVAMSQNKNVPPDHAHLYRVAADRLYQAFRGEILNRTDEELTALDREAQGQLIGAMRDLAYLYRALQLEMPREKKKGDATPLSAADLNPAEFSMDKLAKLTQRIQGKEEKGPVLMLERLYQAFKPAVYDTPVRELKTHADRPRLIKALRDLLITANLLDVTLEEPPQVNKLDLRA